MFAAQIVDDLLDGEATCLVNDVPEGEAPLGITNEDDNYESRAGAATPHLWMTYKWTNQTWILRNLLPM